MSNIRSMVLIATFVASSVPAAFADTGTTWVGGEIGFTSHPTQSSRTRQQVRDELIQFQRDGGKLAQGEMPAIAHEHTYRMQGGAAVHADPYGTMGNVVAPSPTPRPASARPTWDPYFNGGPN